MEKIPNKPKNQQQLKKKQGGTATFLLPTQIPTSKYFKQFKIIQQQIKQKFPEAIFNSSFDRIYLNKVLPVGQPPVAGMKQRYTPPTNCVRLAVTTPYIQKVLENEKQYYFAYHCVYNKPQKEIIQIINKIIKNGFIIPQKWINGRSHGNGTYVTPSFSTIVNYYAKMSYITIKQTQYSIILQVRVKQGSFTKHPNTAYLNDDWCQSSTQWLIAEPSQQNIVVTGLLLRNTQIFQ